RISFDRSVLLCLSLLLVPASSSTPSSGQLTDLAQQRGWPPCQRKDRAGAAELSPLAFAAARLSDWDIRPHIVCLINEVTQATVAATKAASSSTKVRRRRLNRLRKLRLALADCLLELDERDLAELVYKEAASTVESGDAAPSIEDWHRFGWFPIGTGELDADPVLSAFGSLPNAVATVMLRSENFDRRKLFTEFFYSSTMEWTPVDTIDSNGVIRLAPEVPWGELVNSLGSTAALEFQGWLIGGVYTTKEINDADDHKTDLQWSLVCDGPAAVTVDDVVDLSADRYMRGRAVSSVAGRLLTNRRGVHLLAARVRGKQAAAVSCRFVSAAATGSKFRAWPPDFLPDLLLLEGQDAAFLTGASAPIFVPVVSLRTGGALSCRLDCSGDKIDCRMGPTKPIPSKDLAPGQLGFIAGDLQLTGGGTGGKDRRAACKASGDSLRLKLRLSCKDSGPAQEMQVTLRCRRPDQSVLFTFVDHDGSVQRAAAIAPIEWQGGTGRSQKSQAVRLPIVVSLHGTSIKPEDQADSHKFIEAGRDASAGYRFGISGAWLLAPSRHGAHNWEGPGALTAMRAVEVLAEVATVELPAADPDRLVFLGHSMGGHGALVLATHWPGRAIGVASLSGWLRKEDYGDNNVYFRHDLSSWQVSPKLKSILEAANAENYVDSHLTNIKVSINFLDVTAKCVSTVYFFSRLFI
ncbi:hypothetical protein BOX15_Mlig010965g3, partial [Macrostomum lignano]